MFITPVDFVAKMGVDGVRSPFQDFLCLATKSVLYMVSRSEMTVPPPSPQWVGGGVAAQGSAVGGSVLVVILVVIEVVVVLVV